MNETIEKYDFDKVDYVVSGGRTGFESTYFGLKAVQYESDNAVLIHDGNRPCISDEMINSAFEVYSKNGNAVAAIPCVEILYKTEDHLVATSHINRDKVMRTQTPQIYTLKEALDEYSIAMENDNIDYASTTELYFSHGKKLFFSKGSETNIKITYPEDLVLFEAMLQIRNNVN